MKPRVFFGSYNGVFYALDARSGKVALDAPRRRQDLRRGDRGRRHRLLLQLRQEGHDRARRAHRPRGLPHGPGIVQPRDLRRAHDLPDRLLVAVRAQASEVGRIGKPARARTSLTSETR